jgi:hypothetical protein
MEFKNLSLFVSYKKEEYGTNSAIQTDVEDDCAAVFDVAFVCTGGGDCIIPVKSSATLCTSCQLT